MGRRVGQQIFTDHAIAQCDWLKLDCEGAEYEILYQAPPEIFERITAISLETHPVDERQNNSAALMDFLEQRQFQVYHADDAVIYALKPG